MSPPRSQPQAVPCAQGCELSLCSGVTPSGGQNKTKPQKTANCARLPRGFMRCSASAGAWSVGWCPRALMTPARGGKTSRRPLQPQLVLRACAFHGSPTCCCRISVNSAVNVCNFHISALKPLPRAVPGTVGRSPMPRGPRGCGDMQGLLGGVTSFPFGTCVCVG